MGFWLDFFKDKRFTLDFKIANFIMGDSLRSYLATDRMILNMVMENSNLNDFQKRKLNKICNDLNLLMSAKGDSYMRHYWVVFKNGEYVSGTDEFGYPLHTKNKEEAWKFYDFNVAMNYFNLGYAIIKEGR